MIQRNPRYTFTNMRDLKDFFSVFLPMDVVKSTIERLKKEFKARPDTDKRTAKLQFLKKCEWELNRIKKGEK